MSGEIGGLYGAALAMALMALVTYLCRIGGVVLMSRMTLTPAIERALRALPGSIVVATVIPLGVQGGVAAVMGLVAGLIVMILTRIELAALLAGLAVVSLARATGL